MDLDFFVLVFSEFLFKIEKYSLLVELSQIHVIVDIVFIYSPFLWLTASKLLFVFNFMLEYIKIF